MLDPGDLAWDMLALLFTAALPTREAARQSSAYSKWRAGSEVAAKLELEFAS